MARWNDLASDYGSLNDWTRTLGYCDKWEPVFRASFNNYFNSEKYGVAVVEGEGPLAISTPAGRINTKFLAVGPDAAEVRKRLVFHVDDPLDAKQEHLLMTVDCPREGLPVYLVGRTQHTLTLDQYVGGAPRFLEEAFSKFVRELVARLLVLNDSRTSIAS